MHGQDVVVGTKGDLRSLRSGPRSRASVGTWEQRQR